MSTIPARKYVTVIPNVLSAGGAALDLVATVLTKSWRVPIGAVQPFPSKDGLSAYFGPGSNEAALGAVYFAGFDGSSAKPGLIRFTQYPATAVPAYLLSGIVSGYPLATVQAMTGSLTVMMDGYTYSTGSLSLSGATSFSAAAALIQSALTTTPPTAAVVTGAISGTTLTVSAVTSGTVSVGQTVTGTGVATGTIVTALGTGTGLNGTYTVNNSQTVTSGTLTMKGTAFTVEFDSISGCFRFVSGITGVASTSAFAAGTLATQLFLTSATGAMLSQGAAAAVPGPFMDGVVSVTQDWATFMTAFDPDNGSGNAVKLAFAAWSNSQQNRYAYVAQDKDITPTATVPASQSLGQLLSLNGYSGTIPVYEPTNLYHAAFVCGMVASINFNTIKGRITLAFKGQDGLAAGVSNETIATNLELNGYNYYGAVATANQGFRFFYPGAVSGKFQWADSYVNQIWLNNQLQLALLELETNVNSIPYNLDGYGLVEAAILDPTNQGLNNGVITAGVTLSEAQKAEVKTIVGKDVSETLQTRGWYLSIQDAQPQVRQARKSPPCTFFYMDGESIQQITLNSVNVQ